MKRFSMSLERGKSSVRPFRSLNCCASECSTSTGLVCSVGAAATKFVAKLASGMSKPNGLLVVPRDDTIEFLHPLPIARLWGVGGKTEEALRGRGYNTIGDLARTPVEVLKKTLGDAAATRLHELSWGIDDRVVRPGGAEKSVGHEVTFETDATDPAIVRRELLRLANMVAVRLRKSDFVARTVVLKLRFADFSTITRSRTLAEPTDLGRTIYEEVRAIYEATGKQSEAIRLVGVRAEQLQDATTAQLGLWDPAQGWRDAETVMDAATARFGRGAVTPARLIGHSAMNARVWGSATEPQCHPVPVTSHQVTTSSPGPAVSPGAAVFTPAVGTFAAENLSPAYPERAARGTADKLRAWQAEALDEYFAREPRDFLAAATPGAGKTTFALRLAVELMARRVIDRDRRSSRPPSTSSASGRMLPRGRHTPRSRIQ